MAVNLTYLQNSRKPDDQYYKERLEAALDTNCNGIVQIRGSPIEMLEGIISRRARTGGQKPSAGCVTFHCQVLLNALLPSVSTELTNKVGMECTNKRKLKPPENAASCPCTDLLGNFNVEKANKFRTLCGSMAGGLTGSEMYQQILGQSKDACYAATIQNSLSTLTKNANCTYLMQTADSAFEWFTLKKREEDLYQLGRLPYKFNVPSNCALEMCDVFNKTLHSPNCLWNEAPRLMSMTENDRSIVASNCPSFGFSAKKVCEIVGPGPVFCQAPPTLAPPTPAPPTPQPAGGGASSRRLHGRELPAPPVGTPQPAGASPALQRADGRRHCRGRTAGREGHSTSVGAAGAEAGAAAALTEEGAAEGGRQWRQLQEAPTPAPAPASDNNKLENWRTSTWSKCTCLLHCMEGVKSRSVTCPAGMKCKEPKPPEATACFCSHCAKCNVVFVSKCAAVLYWAQGALCLMLTAAFYGVSSFTEDDLSDMRCATKLLGCCCKVLPVFVRASVYLNLLWIIFIAAMVLPVLDIAKDCSSSSDLEWLIIVASCFWVSQLGIGMIMHRRQRMPAWLHNPVKSGWAKILLCPIRAIGP
eukprot:CAMPEP_0179044202 /NCGR_PEP_ID=MMETSP0796-20121207/17556_1 /TAXON_ID=73915 /ORGANISM="Pyrodinium bahamense, Strain pbaha01" /LENGTH=586 /DNA_ID=CAMNT_0020740601 /DNA_START=353 /DNA_END=2113 /DNA_ORIENTATION=+